MAENNADDNAPVRRRQRQRRVAGGRPHRHNIRLSREEHRRVTVAAEKAGLSVPMLFVETMRAALSEEGQPNVADRRGSVDELVRIRRDLKAIGVNVNQVAMVANTTGQVQPDLSPTTDALTAILNRLDNILGPARKPRRTS